MAYKLKWYLDLRRKDEQGKGRLCIVIYNRGTSAMLSTGVMLCEGEFVNGRVVGAPMAAQLTQLLRLKMAKVQLTVEEVACFNDVQAMRASEIKAALLDRLELNGNGGEAVGKEKQEEARFLPFAETFVSRCKKERTAGVYKMTLQKLRKFCKLEELCFKDVTVGWLKDFEVWMADTCSTNTRGIHFRNIRAVFNAAIDEEVIPAEMYPFRRFKIKKEETMKRSLRLEDLRRLMRYPCEEWQKRYVDLFMLSFYLAGINMIDLMELPPLNESGVIEYRRSKTGVVCRLTVPPEALEIIERYKGVKRLLYFGERLSGGVEAWKGFLRNVNDGLQRVGPSCYVYVKHKGKRAKERVKVYSGLFPDLTSYWARHTWATLASELDVPDAVIDAALGHKSPYPMADIYIRRNAKKVDEAVRRVIDYVRG